MARILIASPEQAKRWQRLVLRIVKRQSGGFIPGMSQILLVDLRIARPTLKLYHYLGVRTSSPLSRLQREMLAVVVNGLIGGAPWLGLHTAAVRRLTGDEQLSPDFATTWPTYELDAKTRALLRYATTLTEAPGLLDDADVEALRAVGWDERAIYEATALIALFNYSGRLEAASGLPLDQVPIAARLP